MALRIGNQPEEAPLPEEQPIPEAPEKRFTSDKVDPVIAGYRPPESGPFQCSNCEHFMEGTCEIVAGPVDPAGVCNLFVPMSQEAPIEEPLPVEEMPVEPVE